MVRLEPDATGRAEERTVNAASSRMGDILQEPLAIREKLVALIVEVAKREWPQRWTNFLDGVVGWLQAGYTQADISVRVIRRLMEDAFGVDFNMNLPLKRRTEILSALHSMRGVFVPALVCFCRRSIPRGQLGSVPTGELCCSSMPPWNASWCFASGFQPVPIRGSIESGS